jgi:hypothetical protein
MEATLPHYNLMRRFYTFIHTLDLFIFTYKKGAFQDYLKFVLLAFGHAIFRLF